MGDLDRLKENISRLGLIEGKGEDALDILERLLSKPTKDAINSDLAPFLDAADESVIEETVANLLKAAQKRLPPEHPMRKAIEGVEEISQ